MGIVISLNDVWVKEIEGKMINVNTLSKQDAVALIGAHTVGRAISFGPWTQQPFFFDNEYFLQLKRVKDWLDSGNSLGQGPFSQIVFPDWFMGSMEVEDSHPVMPPMNPFPQINQKAHIMMLDADLALVLNAPELVEKYAADNKVWRKDFDDAYIVMSELGFTSLDPPREGSNRRLLQRSEELLDEDFEFLPESTDSTGGTKQENPRSIQRKILNLHPRNSQENCQILQRKGCLFGTAKKSKDLLLFITTKMFVLVNILITCYSRGSERMRRCP